MKNRGYIFYRHDFVKDGKRRQLSIGKDPEMTAALAHKAYNLELLRRLDLNIALIEKAFQGSCSLELRDILNALPASLKNLPEAALLQGRSNLLQSRTNQLQGKTKCDLNWPHPVNSGLLPWNAKLQIDPAERFDWAAKPYLANTTFPEHKIHLSPRGVLCRSKSEGSILGIYDELRIPYHCDEHMYINGRSIAPDIVGCREDGILIFHEHKGMDSEAYKRNSYYKDIVYRSAGIVQGRNLIYTFDRPDGSINLPLIKEIIKDTYGIT